MSSKANEHTFQSDMILQLVANGWLLGLHSILDLGPDSNNVI